MKHLQRRRIGTRVLSILFALCLMIGLLPARASAEDSNQWHHIVPITPSRLMRAMEQYGFVNSDELGDLNPLDAPGYEIENVIQDYITGVYEAEERNVSYNSGGSGHETDFTLLYGFEGDGPISATIWHSEMDSAASAVSLAEHYCNNICSNFSYRSKDLQIYRPNGVTNIFEAPNGNGYVSLMIVYQEGNIVMEFHALSIPLTEYPYHALSSDTISADDWYTLNLGFFNTLGCFEDHCEEKISDSCDYVLAEGYDTQRNYFELVADQEETARGFSIRVGILENNSWLYPLSADFPFLAEDGKFHVTVPMGGKSGSTLNQVSDIVQNLYFIDSGAFLLDCHKSNDSLSLYDHFYIIVSCYTGESITIDCSDSTLLVDCTEPRITNGAWEAGLIRTDGRDLIMYTETSGTSSGWTEDGVYRWDVLDSRFLDTNTIATVKGLHPVSCIYDGLFVCSDMNVYNTSGQKVIDLSDYTITSIDTNGFRYGLFSFKAKSPSGTYWRVTIDEGGNTVREYKVNAW